MRKAFFAELHVAMQKDPRIYFLTGDLGYGLVEPLLAEFPGRAINCGVIEQTMIGIAAGLAKHGKIPFVYSIAPFVTLRCLEQIRNDVVAHRLPVRVVGVGEGDSYRTAGVSHSFAGVGAALDAIGMLRVSLLPSASATLNAQFAESLINEAIENPSPMFIGMP